ncbi:LOW QUALITY PROTEIN: cysteine and tyrosine-rich protein 1 [Hippocampus comes]|uniref:LOW QUALITY PROTEIN: cysteine and tyrosine-rich protein 1 n=1 Tax=Hippocampus comes TaxID=109280 RepID=UPI00094EC3B9|nr:PREDICTED: LOW QUALITY PROTEIN: cysteine and tyrosine-rich protein 1 [Hippocampus comes]
MENSWMRTQAMTWKRLRNSFLLDSLVRVFFCGEPMGGGDPRWLFGLSPAGPHGCGSEAQCHSCPEYCCEGPPPFRCSELNYVGDMLLCNVKGTAISGIVFSVVFLLNTMAALLLCVCMYMKNGHGARVGVFSTSCINTVTQGYPGLSPLKLQISCQVPLNCSMDAAVLYAIISIFASFVLFPVSLMQGSATQNVERAILDQERRGFNSSQVPLLQKKL